MTAKQKVLPSDIEWHFIGPLQSNQGKRHCPVHPHDTQYRLVKTFAEVNKQAAKHDRIIRVLLEIHIAQEEAKHGFSPDECRELLYNLLPEPFPTSGYAD